MCILEDTSLILDCNCGPNDRVACTDLDVAVALLAFTFFSFSPTFVSDLTFLLAFVFFSPAGLVDFFDVDGFFGSAGGFLLG